MIDKTTVTKGTGGALGGAGIAEAATNGLSTAADKAGDALMSALGVFPWAVDQLGSVMGEAPMLLPTLL